MRAFDIIAKKRDGESLTEPEIDFMVGQFMAGRVSDAQMGAWLMAVFWRGFDGSETASLTRAFISSGESVDLSDIPGPKADKHSTGGVGDKVTLIVVPLVAAAGIKVPKMSGRGLGHTGGTIDKLAAIPGMRTNIGIDEFKRLLSTVGAALVGQSAELVPADKKIYSLRDETATISSAPLIAASVMSKKLASGADSMVIDVKVGGGAFMKTLPEARALAETMVELGRSLDRPVRAVLSNMNRPLGTAVGNALEVEEVISVLRGSGPADVKELSLRIAAEMLILAGLADEVSGAIDHLSEILKDGRALTKFREIITAQGGDPRVVDAPALLPQAAEEVVYTALNKGYLKFKDTARLGMAALELGAGRRRAGEPIDPGAGIVLLKKEGDIIDAGEPLMKLRYSHGADPALAREHIQAALTIDKAPSESGPLVYEVVG